MGRAPLGTLTQRTAVEQCWTLVGTRRGRIWYGRLVDRREGAQNSVEFDGLGVLDREERRRDVIGFFHTHPDGPPRPSARDIRTMRAWCSAFGKPLLCVIASPLGLAAFQFVDDRSDGVPLMSVEVFPRGVFIGVEGDGE